MEAPSREVEVSRRGRIGTPEASVSVTGRCGLAGPDSGAPGDDGGDGGGGGEAAASPLTIGAPEGSVKVRGRRGDGAQTGSVGGGAAADSGAAAGSAPSWGRMGAPQGSVSVTAPAVRGHGVTGAESGDGCGGDGRAAAASPRARRVRRIQRRRGGGGGNGSGGGNQAGGGLFVNHAAGDRHVISREDCHIPCARAVRALDLWRAGDGCRSGRWRHCG